MNLFSEKQQRRVTQYINRLVKAQPRWLKELFKDGRVRFAMDPSGQLLLEVKEDLLAQQKEHAQQLVSKYIVAHKCSVLEEKDVH